jgi:hypothetical protein
MCKDPKYVPPAPVSQRQLKITNAELKLSVSVVPHEDMSLRQLRDMVCTQNNLPPDQYGFQHPTTGAHLLLDMVLEQLEGDATNEIKLYQLPKRPGSSSRKSSKIAIKEEGDATRQVTKLLGAIFFFTPATASKYQEYPVMKSNKFGVKQDRILGIDANRIVRLIPDKKTHSKKSYELVSEVLRAQMIPAKPGNFVVEFKGKTFKYESAQAGILSYFIRVQTEL